jgi:hypothetical protein
MLVAEAFARHVRDVEHPLFNEVATSSACFRFARFDDQRRISVIGLPQDWHAISLI